MLEGGWALEGLHHHGKPREPKSLCLTLAR